MTTQQSSSMRIERLSDHGGRQAFRLHFDLPKGRVYVSEIYYAHPRAVVRKAGELCRRFGWDKQLPCASVSQERARELLMKVEAALSEFDRRPERFVPDANKFWRSCFENTADDFYMDSSAVLGGDAPIPFRDDDGWTTYDHAEILASYVPLNVQNRPAKGVHGIQIIKLMSCDADGNWDTEASFVRKQKGARLTEEDTALLIRRKETRERLLQKAAANPENPVTRKWYKADNEYRAQRMVMQYAAEDSWDASEFQYQAAKMNCYWRLLMYKRYELWCYIYGRDPLNNVRPATRHVRASWNVTVRTKPDGSTTHDLVRVSGAACTRKLVYNYMRSATVPVLTRAALKAPKLDPSPDSTVPRFGWVPLSISKHTAKVQVNFAGPVTLPVTPARIRAVSGNNIEEQVLQLLHDMDTHHPSK